jgi:hypothetical protein
MIRDIRTIIERIKKEVPEDCQERERLFLNLNYIVEQYSYFAPEGNDEPTSASAWVKLSSYLVAILKFPDTPWKQRIADIMAGRDE